MHSKVTILHDLIIDLFELQKYKIIVNYRDSSFLQNSLEVSEWKIVSSSDQRSTWQLTDVM